MKSFTAHYKELTRLGLPIVIGQLGIIFVSFADTFMVGRHGTNDLAAASFVNNMFNLAIIFATGFSYGLTPIIGKLFGKGKLHDAGGMLKNALVAYLDVRREFASAADGALFLSARRTRVCPAGVYRMVNKRLTDVTSVKKKSPHVLRHSFATAMLNNKAEIGAVKELLGHRRLATTEIYTHLSFEDLKGFYEKAHPRAGEQY